MTIFWDSQSLIQCDFLQDERTKKLGWEALPHLAYSINPAPFDFYLFERLKDASHGKRVPTPRKSRKRYKSGFDTNQKNSFPTELFSCKELMGQCMLGVIMLKNIIYFVRIP